MILRAEDRPVQIAVSGTPPARVEPITLQMAIDHLRWPPDTETAVLALDIAASRAYFEDQTGRQCIDAVWEYALDGTPAGSVLELPRPPLRSVSAVRVVDASGAVQLVDPASYRVYPSGPDGAPAARAGVASAVLYTFSNKTTDGSPPMGDGELRFDAGAPYVGVTTIWLANRTADGVDVQAALLACAPGTTIYFQDEADHAANVTVDTTGAAVNKGTYVELPVAWTANGATAFQNNRAVLAGVLTPAPAPADPMLIDPYCRCGRIEWLSGPPSASGPRSLRIERVCGYGPDAAAMPALVQATMLTLVTYFHNRRDDALPLGLHALVNGFKWTAKPARPPRL